MSDPGPEPAPPRRVLGWAGVLAALGALLSLRGLPLWWLGGGCIVAAGALCWHAYGGAARARWATLQQPRTIAGRSIVPAAALTEALCLAVITTVATIMMADVFAGERPVSFDHTVHYFKAHQLHDRFLPEGRLYGWSQRWFAGYPVNYLYPIGADLWVNLVHALALGLLSFSRAYGVAFWLMHVMSGVAAHRLGTAIGGRAVGLLTALLLLTDLSEFRHGGWAYTVVYGVWPQALSVAFAMLALRHLPALFEGRTHAPVGAFGLWMGLAILSHPIVLLFLVVLAVAGALSAVLAPEVRAATGMARLLLAYGIAGLIACAWLLPFLSTRALTLPMGVWWDSSWDMGGALWELTTLPGTIGYVLAFGLAALWLALRSGRFALLLPATMCVLVPAVFNSTFVDELHLAHLLPPLSKLQYLRMSTMVKPFWFALASYFVVAILRYGLRLLPPRPETPRSAFRTGATALCLGMLVLPVAVPTAEYAFEKHVHKDLRTTVDRQFQEDREALTAWLRKTLPRDHFYRLGIFTAHNHDLFDLAEALDLPMYKRGFTPCSNFVYKMATRENEVLQAVNVRFVIAKKPLPEEDFEELSRHGIYRVFRYRHYRPEPFAVVEGQADVRVRRFEDELVELEVGPKASGKLRLSVSYFPRWRAYRDGKPVPITPLSLAAEPDTTGFISVPLSAGHYRFVFERSLGDQLALPIGLLGILLALALRLLDGGTLATAARVMERTAERLDGLSAPAHARMRKNALLGLGVALGLALVALSEWRPPVELGDALARLRPRAVRYDFLESLSDARVYYDYHDGRRRCRRVGPRFVCPDAEGAFDPTRYVGSSPTTIEEYRMVRCVRARPEQRGPLRIRFRDVPRGDALVGYYGVEFEGRLLFRRRPVRFTVDVGRERVYDGTSEEDNKMNWFHVPLRPTEATMDVRFGVSSPNPYKRWLCFHAQVVDL